ncbi:MAG: sirohydrochlorin cobaltochelatase [Deltaproteobacteria bacterium]|nr:sirohydrochlorin cobaltochelatase [Deltaproteobacteria bacterium]
MNNRIRRITPALICLLALLFLIPHAAHARHKRVHKKAVIIAMFGTTVEPALKSLLNIRRQMQARFPHTLVKIAFTSNIIRRIWHKRDADPVYRRAHPGVPADIINVKGPLAVMADLQDSGFDTLVIQPTFLASGEEFLDLGNYVKALNGIQTIKKKYKPFNKVALGRPAFGTFGPVHPYSKDIAAAVRALAGDALAAKKMGAALFYMGHGNKFFPSGGTYLEFEKVMNQVYPGVHTIVGCVEGFPTRDDAIAKLKKTGMRKVMLKALMVVAGDHARNDMAGPKASSWLSILTKEGFKVTPVIKGLGENDAFAAIFVNHAADAARDAMINLQ